MLSEATLTKVSTLADHIVYHTEANLFKSSAWNCVAIIKKTSDINSTALQDDFCQTSSSSIYPFMIFSFPSSKYPFRVVYILHLYISISYGILNSTFYVFRLPSWSVLFICWFCPYIAYIYIYIYVFQINRKMVNIIWFLFDLIRFRKYLSVCNLPNRYKCTCRQIFSKSC